MAHIKLLFTNSPIERAASLIGAVLRQKLTRFAPLLNWNFAHFSIQILNAHTYVLYTMCKLRKADDALAHMHTYFYCESTASAVVTGVWNSGRIPEPKVLALTNCTTSSSLAVEVVYQPTACPCQNVLRTRD